MLWIWYCMDRCACLNYCCSLWNFIHFGQKKKKRPCPCQGRPCLLVILQCAPPFRWTELTFADPTWLSLHSVEGAHCRITHSSPPGLKRLSEQLRSCVTFFFSFSVLTVMFCVLFNQTENLHPTSSSNRCYDKHPETQCRYCACGDTAMLSSLTVIG